VFLREGSLGHHAASAVDIKPPRWRLAGVEKILEIIFREEAEKLTGLVAELGKSSVPGQRHELS
jgi:hypothetical protein